MPSASGQVFNVPRQMPAPVHWSFVVHVIPSLQLWPIFAALGPQKAKAPAVMHWPQPPPHSAPKAAGVPTHSPETQVSPVVQELPSSHEPPVRGEPAHIPSAQMSLTVQTSKSSHC